MVREVTSHFDIRENNRRRVLELVARSEMGISRAAMARETGLTSATISSIVSDLGTEGYLVSGGLAESTGGKPAVIMRVNPDGPLIGTLLVSSHSTSAALMTIGGKVSDTFRVNNSNGKPAAIEESFAELHRLAKGRLISVGLVVPGTVFESTVHESVQLGIEELDLSESLSAVAPTPFVLINDANTGAVAAYALRASRPGDLLYVSVGEGIGAGLVFDGKLRRGVNWRAGEIGHLRVDTSESAPVCQCGAKGCLESVTALRYMLQLGPDEPLEETVIQFAANAHSAEARIINAAESLAAIIVTICAADDIDEVVVGGPVKFLGDAFLAPLQKKVREWRPKGSAPLTVTLGNISEIDVHRGAGSMVAMDALGVSWV